MPRSWPAFLAVAGALGLLLGGCEEDESGSPTATRDRSSLPRPSRQAQPIRTTPARCDVGERPGYFVPGSERDRLALLGCARLGVSGKRIEFSGNLDEIDGELHFCMNPAYSGRGQRGFYIPALCAFDPLQRFAIHDAEHPRQGVRGYALVIWGTAAASTTEVVARAAGQTARAAVFKVGPALARRFDRLPFSFFVLELPLRAACVPVSVRDDRSGATRRIGRKPNVCRRGRKKPA